MQPFVVVKQLKPDVLPAADIVAFSRGADDLLEAVLQPEHDALQLGFERLAIVNRLDTGNCHINCSPVNDEPHVPFGGFKGSGSGKHGGRWSMETFTETRWITMERGGRPYPPVF